MSWILFCFYRQHHYYSGHFFDYHVQIVHFWGSWWLLYCFCNQEFSKYFILQLVLLFLFRLINFCLKICQHHYYSGHFFDYHVQIVHFLGGWWLLYCLCNQEFSKYYIVQLVLLFLFRLINFCLKISKECSTASFLNFPVTDRFCSTLLPSQLQWKHSW